MRLVLGQDEAVAAWAARRMPIPVKWTDIAAIGVSEDGELVAAAIFTDYRVMPFGKDIHVNFAAESPRWALRGIIRGILSYPFVQLGCDRLTTIISRKNKRARRLNEGLGFRLEGVHWKAYDGRSDAITYCLRRSVAEERWLKGIS